MYLGEYLNFGKTLDSFLSATESSAHECSDRLNHGVCIQELFLWAPKSLRVSPHEGDA